MQRQGSGGHTGGRDEGVLLKGIGARDRAALRTLFDHYVGRVLHLAERRLGDVGMAEEVVADVFCEIWRSAERFQGQCSVSTWVFGITHFKCVAARRFSPQGSVIPLLPARARLADRTRRPRSRRGGP